MAGWGQPPLATHVQPGRTCPSVRAMTSPTKSPPGSLTTRVAASAVRRVKRLLMQRILEPTWKLEDDLAARPGGVHADDASPRRIEIVAE